jgi:hypothetical protein
MRSREGFGGAIITFNHDRGEWATGSGDKKTIIDGRKLVAGVGLLLVGWQKFVDKKPFYADVGFVRDRHVPRTREKLDELGKVGSKDDPWKLTYFLPAQDPETRQHCIIVTHSTTGKDALAMLQIAFVEHSETQPDRAPQWPIVTLANDGSFISQHGGKIWKPLYEIVDWTDPPPNFQAVTAPPDTAKIEHKPDLFAVAAGGAGALPIDQDTGDEIPF